MRIFDPKLTGSIEFLNPIRGGMTGSIFGSSSYALTASYALNGGGGGGTPGGSNTQIQYNNGGSFGGVSTATFDGTTLRATGSFSGSLTGIASTASFVSLGAVNQNVIITGSVTISGSAVPELFVLGDSQFTGSLRVLGNVSATSLTGSITASSLQGAILNSQLQNSSVTVGTTAIALGSSATTIAGITSLTSTNITASIISASSHISGGQIIARNGFTGSITASSLQGDIILGTQTSGQYASTIAGGAGLTATTANATDGTAYTIDAVAGAGISLTAPTNDAINIDTGSAHFTGGVTNRLNSSNVLSGSVSSPSQGTISVGGFTNIDLGLQTNDNVTFNNITSTGNVVIQGNLTAQQFIVSSSVYFTTTSFSSGSTIFGNSLDDTHQFTGSLRITGSITGSLLGTASFVTGSIFSGTNLAVSSSNAITASYVRNLYISASETANASPTPNELWYDASTGKTYIRYRSGSNEAWVLQSDPTIDVTTSLQTLQEVTDLGSTTTNAVAITNTTNAIDSASGALIVSGGAGFRLDVWARKFYGDGSGLTGVSATYTETDTLQTVTTRGNETSASVFVTNTTNATSKTVGALRVSGGLAVEQDIFAERVRATSFTGSLFGTASFSTTASYALNAAAASSFPFTGSAIISGSLIVTGSVNVDRGVTGSLLGTASYARQALTASNANTASFALTASFLLGGGSQVAIQEEGSPQGSAGTLNFVGTSVTATVGGGTATITVTGGSGTSDFPYTGSAIISGSLIITGSARILADGRDGFESFGNVNDYFEIFAQNLNNGISASSDIVAYNDQGNKTQNYVDMGINSSGISPTYSFGKANDAYVYNTGGDLFIGNSTAFYQPTRTSQSLHLFANAPGIPDLTITGSRIGIQKSSSLNATLDVLGNVIISGALHISGSAVAELKVLGDSEFTGSVRVTNGIIAQSVTASLQGSASYAITASYALNGGGGGGNSFETIAVAGQSDVVAESSTDTLTLVAGSGMTITTDAGTDTITFASPAPNIFSRGITIADPTNAENATIMFTTASLTINRLAAVIQGTATPGVTFTLRYAATRSLTGTEVITGGTRVNTTGSALISSSGFTNATVPANNFVWLQTTNISGSVSELFVQFYY